MSIDPVLTDERLAEIDDDFTQENWHSEASMLRPFLVVVASMEQALITLAEAMGLGDEQDEIITILSELSNEVDRLHP
jgi:hypothetical protein